MNNYTESIARKQFETESIDSGIRITYTMGDSSLGIEALPKLISKKRMKEKVTSKISEADANYVTGRYFPLKDNPDVWERQDSVVEKELVLKRMLKAFNQAGYSEEDLAFDNEENGIGGLAGSDKPNFTISIEYRLDGDSFSASVPTDKIKESGEFRIRMLNVLEFFGAAGTTENGYMFVPDGTGALIKLNSGKIRDEVYAQRVYGEDENNNSTRRGQVAQSARLPVFGLKSGDDAWLAEIARGDGIASINADISGRNNEYNNAYVSFAVRGEDTLDLYKGNTVEEIKLLTEQIFQGNVELRYRFLNGDKANYTGMAALYRSELINKGALEPLDPSKDLPFYLSVLGAVDKRKAFLGVPYAGMVAMTTLDQAREIVSQLNKDGIHNIQMRYMGWFNKGFNHKTPTVVKLDSVLGRKSDLKKLADQLKQTGGQLYPDVSFQHLYHNDIRIAPASDAARYITREQALQAPYNRALNRMWYNVGSYYLLSPAKLPHFVDQFMRGYNKYKIDAVSLRDLGDLLNSDYRVSRVINRDVAKSIVSEQLNKFKQANSSVLVAGGNAYSIAAAKHIVDAPTSMSLFNIVDEQVPFYQMVLHGYKNYAGSPINLDDEQNVRKQLLQAVEFGAAPHFMWSYESSSKLKFTQYDWMFSTLYTDWYEEAVDMYNRANSVLKDVHAVPMTDHIVYANGVVEIRYENGQSIYVNYSDEAATVNGTKVEAQNFAAGGGSK